jgi:hypothetical protein
MSLFFYTLALVAALIATGLQVGEPRGDVFLASAAVVLIMGIAADHIISALRRQP